MTRLVIVAAVHTHTHTHTHTDPLLNKIVRDDKSFSISRDIRNLE